MPLLKYLSHKTSIGNCRRALDAANYFLQNNLYNDQELDLIKTETLAYIDSICLKNDMPALFELYDAFGLDEPAYTDKFASSLANSLVRRYAFVRKDSEEYYMNALATAFFAMISTPFNFSNRHEQWIRFARLLDLNEVIAALKQAGEEMQR